MSEINEGDDVLLYLDRKRTYLVTIRQGKSFHTDKGFVQLDKLIGKRYGSQIMSSMNIKITALKPTLQDYIFKMQRKTQITYPKDVALILMFSNAAPGSNVVEAGTGTGALTTALAYHVRPTGHVYSYEIRREFIEMALKNVARARVSDFITVKNKDITEGIEETDVDAVVLDLATPWLVIPHAHTALKGSGIVISFSPTIDQVVKTVEAMEDHGFAAIETVECFMRGLQIKRGRTRPQTLMTGHTGYLTYARKTLRM